MAATSSPESSAKYTKLDEEQDEKIGLTTGRPNVCKGRSSGLTLLERFLLMISSTLFVLFVIVTCLFNTVKRHGPRHQQTPELDYGQICMNHLSDINTFKACSMLKCPPISPPPKGNQTGCALAIHNCLSDWTRGWGNIHLSWILTLHFCLIYRELFKRLFKPVSPLYAG